MWGWWEGSRGSCFLKRADSLWTMTWWWWEASLWHWSLTSRAFPHFVHEQKFSTACLMLNKNAVAFLKKKKQLVECLWLNTSLYLVFGKKFSKLYSKICHMYNSYQWNLSLMVVWHETDSTGLLLNILLNILLRCVTISFNCIYTW